MRVVRFNKQFDKDLRRMAKSGKDLEKVKVLIRRIAKGEPLEDRYRNHRLVGNYQGFMECHVEPDWLLIYRLTDDLVLFARTGTHSQLFKK